MRAEAVRIIAAWLRDDTYGVAAKLAAVPLDGSDTRPTTIADASIVDETQDANAAFGRFDGLTLPALIVSCTEVRYEPATPIQSGEYADGYVTIQVRYAERSVAPATAMTDGDYVVKAVIASLRELHLNANDASRTRNSVQLVSCESLVEQGIYQEVDDAWLVAGIEARYYARTIIPMGA